MSINLLIDGFLGENALLNGQKWTLPLTHNDFTRSLLCTSYQTSPEAQDANGMWRALMLKSLATGYLTPSLSTSTYFSQLHQKEQDSATHLFALALERISFNSVHIRRI